MTIFEGMVKKLTEHFQKDQIEILQAHCSGFDNPTNIEGVEPDVIGWDSEKSVYHIGIVADSESISSDLTKKKIIKLSRLMMGRGPSEGERLPFFLGVTQDASTTADEKLQESDVLSQGNVKKIIV